MIPVGTLCYMTDRFGPITDYAGDVHPRPCNLCTVTAVGGYCIDPECQHDCLVAYADGDDGCCMWGDLIPITPPKQSVDTKHDELVPA